ncbi:hypothetical protein [Actinomadura sp. NPDC048394]|uniref:hypothetical protein n=1 Tax=Actinomadura sp. NPDC048394 TaxID=3158223 RepID=UPI0033D9FEDB
MGYDHWISEAISIDPPIPASQIPSIHPLHPNHHPVCSSRYTGERVQPDVYGHAECVCAPDLMFEIADGQAVAIVPGSPVGHKLGAPVRQVEDVVAEYGTGRRFGGCLLFEGECGEEWSIEVIDGRVVVNDEEGEGDEDEADDDPVAEHGQMLIEDD